MHDHGLVYVCVIVCDCVFVFYSRRRLEVVLYLCLVSYTSSLWANTITTQKMSGAIWGSLGLKAEVSRPVGAKRIGSEFRRLRMPV